MSPSEKKPVSTRLATAVPGAIGAALFIGAVAFGATSIRSAAELQAGRADATASAEIANPKFGATVAAQRRDEFAHDPKPFAERTDAPEPEAANSEPTKTEPTAAEKQQTAKPQPTAESKPAPVETKKPAPTAKPAPVPTTPGSLALDGWAKDTRAKLAWTPFGGEGFAYYKVVRSGDSHVTWPASGDDQVVGVVGDRNAPWHVDKPACGTAWNYAVFAVRHGDAGYVTLATSNVATVSVACAPPPVPIEVKPLAFQLHVNPGAGITLAWEACWSDGFAAYKVVRSKVNADPRFPLNDGAELIAVIGDPNQTVFVDGAVTAGETWTYRVVAVTKRDGAYVPLCETAALAATAQ